MNTTVWLIRYTDKHGQARAVAQLHNCVADYRANIDPRATVQRIDLAKLIEAAQGAADFSFDAAMQRGNYAAALQQFCVIKHALRAALSEPLHAESAPVNDGILRGNADLVPAAHTTLVHTPEPHA